MLSVCVVNYTNDVTRFILHQIYMCSHAMQGPVTRFMLMQTTIYHTRFFTMCCQLRQRYIIHAFLELSNNFVVDITNIQRHINVNIQFKMISHYKLHVQSSFMST